MIACADGQQSQEMEGRARSMDTALSRQMLRVKASPARISADNLPLPRGSPRLKVSKVYHLCSSIIFLDCMRCTWPLGLLWHS